MKAILKHCLIAIFTLFASNSSYAGEVSVHFSPDKETSYTVDGEVSVHYSESVSFIPTSDNALSVYEKLANEIGNEVDINAEMRDKATGEIVVLVFKKAYTEDSKVYFSAHRSDGSFLIWLMTVD